MLHGCRTIGEIRRGPFVQLAKTTAETPDLCLRHPSTSRLRLRASAMANLFLAGLSMWSTSCPERLVLFAVPLYSNPV